MKTIGIILLLLCISLSGEAQFNTLRYNGVSSLIRYNENTKSDEDKSQEMDVDDTIKQPSILISKPLPLPLYVTSPYGYRKDPFNGKRRLHRGIDLRCNADAVLAMFDGTVKKVGYQKNGLGNYIVISHGDFEIKYGHLELIFLEKGDEVKAGDKVAISGATGRSTGPHLHISLKYKGTVTNPLALLAFVEKYNNVNIKNYEQPK